MLWRLIMNQNLKNVKHQAETSIKNRQRALDLLSRPKKLELAMQQARNELLAKLTPADRDLLVKLGINERLITDFVNIDIWGSLQCLWYRSYPSEDFTDSPSATIDSDLQVALSIYHRCVFEGTTLSCHIGLTHDLSKEDELTLRSINVIRTEYEPQRSSIVVSCELPNA